PATHYVDNTNRSATDSGNPRGTSATPRMTIPTTLEAGSVVEVRGGPYTISRTTWVGQGSASAPVFIKGVGSPVFTGREGQIIVGGSYLVVEGLVLEQVRLRLEPGSIKLVIRSNEIRNYPSDGPAAMIGASGVTDSVIMGNHVHDCGDIRSAEELDIIGIVVDDGSENVWVVDNHVHHIAGDSIRVGDNPPAPEPWARLVWIGRNEFHHNQENALDVKQSRDIIVSENKMYGLRRPASRSDDGTALVIHYDPERVWILNNQVYDSSNGIRSTGAVDGLYVIGNEVWDIKHEAGDEYDARSMFGVNAIRANATPDFYAINNTVYRCDAGISYPNGEHGEILNNIVAGLTQPSHHVAVGSRSSANLVRNNVFEGTARLKVGSNAARDCGEARSSFPGQVDHCINADPRFVDPGRLDLHLAAGSPAVDAGTDHPAYDRFRQLYGLDIRKDREGRQRPQGRAFDIGAHERPPQ
ncbi:MAG TPA: right-handed parallel beta-helix repeat-containing protein, partial [Vicinamibacteria bacterium]|nr:right-handed parallel beta-helix repeat-containing protein [Vicinamibacteria bacterium]